MPRILPKPTSAVAVDGPHASPRERLDNAANRFGQLRRVHRRRQHVADTGAKCLTKQVGGQLWRDQDGAVALADVHEVNLKASRLRARLRRQTERDQYENTNRTGSERPTAASLRSRGGRE